ncbi:glycoside hydrolase family 3 protein [Streptomyces clavuligerus]|uniref:beta-N-acetylhexosaminidase n=1 Tax=Streptomyces clavuligerus TaxID=1901 RepID=E2Q4F2_STRCL|nr:glycoside hydrolase family 3 N-terminal domain-containing protein [Streptomyces clavuligerus]ANW20105.1 beta-N-acetylhexosaminidase [Streptomyces clavuligerus]AXU14731.1 glycoside hydrolase family 3 protein [Streptomyces clavuligerus]EFG06990.1 Beta-N-acetylglucosaminidase [Streptomyces clavuligerus]MBY6304757.1 glycoside hydrolase family 3 C-terminal domain-containing protein [Streptomyces clavuligerus]QCS07500.1 beta-N-acetylhexosaminidase [Streptomyces clavuligerus]
MADRNLSRRTLLAAATATAFAAGVTSSSTAAGHTGATGPHESAAARDRRLRRMISAMSLEQKVGQVFCTWVAGRDADEPGAEAAEVNQRLLGVRSGAEAVARWHLGGVIYFLWSGNLVEPHQIADLSNGLQRAAVDSCGVPLLISVDQEHGAIVRIGPPVTQLPGAMALGAGGSVRDARDAGRIAGAELAALGIRQNYAPVADVNVNPANPVINVRSFGADPRAASRMVTAQIHGYEDAGVAACAKHFPGHGDTTVDSHYGLPVINHTRQEWSTLDAPPFRAAIAAGVDAIMTAHLQVPALDPSGDPATLSRPIIDGVLRKELGYDGVIVTDALNMRGVLTKYGEERVPVLALKAGVDQLLYPNNLPLAWNAVLKAVREGEITEARLEESILRLLRLKDRLGLLRRPYVTHAGVDRTVGVRRHLAAADRIAENTTTLLVNRDGLLPLSRRRQRRLLVTGADQPFPTDRTRSSVPALGAALGGLGFTVTALPTGLSPAPERIAEAVAAARGQDAVVVLTYDVATAAAGGQRTLVERLADSGVPVIQLAVRNPYDIARLNGVDAALALYGWTDVELRAAARTIAGRNEPGGALPVPVPRADNPTRVLFPVGHGLSYDD